MYELPPSTVEAIFPGCTDGSTVPSFFDSHLAKHQVQELLAHYPVPSNCLLQLVTPEAALPAQAARGKSVPSDRDFMKNVVPFTDILRPCLRMLAEDDYGSDPLSDTARQSLIVMARLILNSLARLRNERLQQVFGAIIPPQVVAHACKSATAARGQPLFGKPTLDALKSSIELSSSIASLRHTEVSARDNRQRPRRDASRSHPFRRKVDQKFDYKRRGGGAQFRFRGQSQFRKGPHDTGIERPPQGAPRPPGGGRNGIGHDPRAVS